MISSKSKSCCFTVFGATLDINRLSTIPRDGATIEGHKVSPLAATSSR